MVDLILGLQRLLEHAGRCPADAAADVPVQARIIIEVCMEVLKFPKPLVRLHNAVQGQEKSSNIAAPIFTTFVTIGMFETRPGFESSRR